MPQFRVLNITLNPQDDEQKKFGTATYRCYIDNAWHNVDGMKSWMNEDPAEFIRLVTEAFDEKQNKAIDPEK